MGGTISDSILEGTKHFFLLIIYNFKNIGGHVPPPPLPPYSAATVTLWSPVCRKAVDHFLLSRQLIHSLVEDLGRFSCACEIAHQFPVGSCPHRPQLPKKTSFLSPHITTVETFDKIEAVSGDMARLSGKQSLRHLLGLAVLQNCQLKISPFVN